MLRTDGCARRAMHAESSQKGRRKGDERPARHGRATGRPAIRRGRRSSEGAGGRQRVRVLEGGARKPSANKSRPHRPDRRAQPKEAPPAFIDGPTHASARPKLQAPQVSPWQRRGRWSQLAVTCRSLADGLASPCERRSAHTPLNALLCSHRRQRPRRAGGQPNPPQQRGGPTGRCACRGACSTLRCDVDRSGGRRGPAADSAGSSGLCDLQRASALGGRPPAAPGASRQTEGGHPAVVTEACAQRQAGRTPGRGC